MRPGSLTLEALAWLRAIGAALVHLGPDGALLVHSVPFGYDGHPIRRAQALAATTPETMRGLTIPRPVHATSISHLGKEVIVDPSDTSEDLTAEELNATQPVIYRSEREKLDALRTLIKAFGISRVARTARVSRSQIKAFVNQGKTPFASTIAKIDAALKTLGA
jgi:DNA-binding phage protein